MNKGHSKPIDTDDILPRYDFSRGIRGKYAARLAAGYAICIEKTDGTTEETRFVRLPPDVAAALPTDESVYAALREWLQERQSAHAL